MNSLFMYFVPLSLKACVVIPLIMAVRFIIKKQPKIYSYALWAVVFVGLVINIEIKIDKIQPVFTPVRQMHSYVDNRYTGLMDDYIGETEIHHSSTMAYYKAVDKGAKPIISDDGKSTYVVTRLGSYTSPATVQTGVMPMLAVVWTAGILTILFCLLKNLLDFNANLIYTGKLDKHIYLAEGISSPFVYGILKPQIVIPANMADMPLEQIIVHEQIHIKRKDYIIKPVALMIAVLHWFNPLVWIAFRLMCQDMEMSCDEAVLSDTGNKKEYSLRLLSCASENHAGPVAAVLFGESNAESRIKNVLAYKKPAKLVSLLMCAVVAICCTACVVSDKAEEMIPDSPKTFYEQLAEINSIEDVKYKERTVAEAVVKSTLEDYGIEAPETLPEYYNNGLAYYMSKGYKYENNGKTTFSYAYVPNFRTINSVHIHNCDETGGNNIGVFLPDEETFISFAGGLETLDDRLSILSYITQDKNGDIWLNIRKIYFFRPETEDKTIRHKLDKDNYFRVRGLRFLNEKVAFMGQTDTGYIKEGSHESHYTSHETPQANISIDGGQTWLKLDFSQLALPEYFTGYRSCCMTMIGNKIEIRYFTDTLPDIDKRIASNFNECYYIISEDGGLTWTGWIRIWDEDGQLILEKATDAIPVAVLSDRR